MFNFQRADNVTNNAGFFAMCVTFCAFGLGLITLLKNKDRLVLFLSLGVCPMIFYFVIHIAYYAWFLFLAALALSIFIGMGVEVVFKFYEGSREREKAIQYSVSVLLILLFCGTTGKFLLQKQKNFFPTYLTPSHVIGDYLRENTPRGSSVGYDCMGQVGYYSERIMIDQTGIVTDGVVDHLNQKDFNWTYDHYKPDYILENSNPILPYTMKNSHIKDKYQLVHVFDFGKGNIVVLYKRIV
jgi:hypothetical protein